MALDKEKAEILSGRDEAGKFISKNRMQEIAARLIGQTNKKIEQQQGLINRLAKSFESQSKAVGSAMSQQLKHFNQAEKAYSRQASVHSNTTKTVLKNLQSQQKEYSKLAHSILKTQQQAAKSAAKSASSGGSGSWLPGIPNWLTGVAGGILSVAAVQRLSSYVTGLGRLRGEVQSLFNLSASGTPVERISGFLAGLGGADARTRVLPEAQLQGIVRLQQSLQRTLGQEQSEKLTQDLIKSLETMKDLQGFAQLASADVGKALSQYSSFDPANFLTALRAVKMEQDSINQTAASLEDIWNKIKDAAERFAVSFLNQYGGNVNAALEHIGDSVVNVIDRFNQWFTGMQNQFAWLGDALVAVNRGINNIMNKSFGQMAKESYAYWTGGREALYEARKSASYDYDRDTKVTIPKMADYMKTFRQETDKAAQAAKTVQVNVSDTASATAGLLAKQQTLKDLMKSSEIASLETARSNAELSLKESFFGLPSMVDDYMRTAATIGQEITSISEAMKAVDDRTIEGKKQLIEMDTKRLNLTKQQVEMTRKVRDGYLDAVQAQSFGLGAFAKLLISREENVGLGLKYGMAGVNRALGSVAGGAGYEPMKWTLRGLRGINSGKTAAELNQWYGMYQPRMDSYMMPVNTASLVNSSARRPQISRNPTTANSTDDVDKAGQTVVQAVTNFVNLVSRNNPVSTPMSNALSWSSVHSNS